MENISVNNLIENVNSDLPRELLVFLAQNILENNSNKKEAIENFKKETYEFSLKVQKKVINCTGTLLHTNLGRAQVDIGFSGESTNIEYDILKNKRGERNLFLKESMNLLLGSKNVCFVNNNASSLFITLKTLKDEFDINSVIISRGEIIEIGGSYRLPEIIQETGLKMIEVGTTNKTKLNDYRKALNQNKKSLILKVHRSNFSINGFVEEVDLKDLKILSDEKNSILIHDLGSGLVASRKFLKKENIEILDDEPTVQESLESGVDLVMFSGDKLFGSVQSGIIAGNNTMVNSIKNAPLFRTYRCSPLTLFELQETVKKYISKNEKEIPLWEMISMSYEQLEKRLQNLSDKIKLKHTIENDYSLMGGGTLPDKSISSPVLKINRLENENLMNKFLENTIPIIPRINKDNIIIDLRSTSEKNDNVLLEFFESV